MNPELCQSPPLSFSTSATASRVMSRQRHLFKTSSWSGRPLAEEASEAAKRVHASSLSFQEIER